MTSITSIKKKSKGYNIDEHGWVLISESYPKKSHWFEIVQLFFDDYFIQTAWWTGQIWDSGHDIHTAKPIKWRFKL